MLKKIMFLLVMPIVVNAAEVSLVPKKTKKNVERHFKTEVEPLIGLQEDNDLSDENNSDALVVHSNDAELVKLLVSGDAAELDQVIVPVLSPKSAQEKLNHPRPSDPAIVTSQAELDNLKLSQKFQEKAKLIDKVYPQLDNAVAVNPAEHVIDMPEPSAPELKDLVDHELNEKFFNFEKALIMKDVSLAKQISDNFFDINAQDKLGFTLLHIAAKYGNCDMINYLVTKGADISLKLKLCDYTPIYCAACKVDRETVELLNKMAEERSSDQRLQLDQKSYFDFMNKRDFFIALSTNTVPNTNGNFFTSREIKWFNAWFSIYDEQMRKLFEQYINTRKADTSLDEHRYFIRSADRTFYKRFQPETIKKYEKFEADCRKKAIEVIKNGLSVICYGMASNGFDRESLLANATEFIPIEYQELLIRLGTNDQTGIFNILSDLLFDCYPKKADFTKSLLNTIDILFNRPVIFSIAYGYVERCINSNYCTVMGIDKFLIDEEIIIPNSSEIINKYCHEVTSLDKKKKIEIVNQILHPRFADKNQIVFKKSTCSKNDIIIDIGNKSEISLSIFNNFENALKARNNQVAIESIPKGFDLKNKNENNLTLLDIAINYKNMTVVKHLIEIGVIGTLDNQDVAKFISIIEKNGLSQFVIDHCLKNVPSYRKIAEYFQKLNLDNLKAAGLVKVDDNGKIIAPESLANKQFESFSVADALALSRHCAKTHVGGDLWFDAREYRVQIMEFIATVEKVKNSGNDKATSFVFTNQQLEFLFKNAKNWVQIKRIQPY